jgi:hypothetical protein
MLQYRMIIVARDSSVGIATRYGLDGPGIESLWGSDIPHPSRPALGPTQHPLQRVQFVRYVMTIAQRLDFVFQFKEPVHSNRWGCQVSWLVEGFVLTSSGEGDYYL